MYCGKCGKQIEDNAKFCPYCGINCAELTRMKTNVYNGAIRQNVGWSYGTGANIWLGLCTVANIVAGIGSLFTGHILLALLGIVEGCCYGVLWRKKNIYGYYGICAVVVLTIIIMLTQKTGVLAVAGLLNPIITYIVIRNYYGLSIENTSLTMHNNNAAFFKYDDMTFTHVVISIVMGLIIAISMFAKWLRIDFWLSEAEYSLVQMKSFANNAKSIIGWFASSSEADVISTVAWVVLICLVIAAYVIVVLEIVHLVAFFILKAKAKSIGRQASGLALTVSSFYLASMILINIWIMVETSGSYSFNSILQITASPVIVLICSIVQSSVTGKKKNS